MNLLAGRNTACAKNNALKLPNENRLPKPKSPRHGFTLIEMITVFGIFSCMLAFTSLALATMWRTQLDVQEELAGIAAYSHLSRQLRADAHVAKGAELIGNTGEQSTGVTFVRLGSSIDYTVARHRVTRVSKTGDAIVHREIFILPEGTSVAWNLSESNRPLLRVAMKLPDVRLNDSVHIRAYNIDATVGLIVGDRP